jgi:hypothetical protein
MVVAGNGFAASSAAHALLNAGVRDACPTDPHPVERLVNADDSVTTGAGRPDDSRDASGVQHVDEPWDRAQRRKVAVPGQQSGVGFQGPGEFLLV